MGTYEIVRFYRDDLPSKVIKRGLTLDEAQAHCRREDTHGDGWFDGYQKQADDPAVPYRQKVWDGQDRVSDPTGRMQ